MKQAKKDAVYNAIVRYIKQNGYPPSVRDLCELTGFKSTSTVYRYLESLADDEVIEKGCFGQPRAIKLVGYEYRKGEDKNEGYEN